MDRWYIMYIHMYILHTYTPLLKNYTFMYIWPYIQIYLANSIINALCTVYSFRLTWRPIGQGSLGDCTKREREKESKIDLNERMSESEKTQRVAYLLYYLVTWDQNVFVQKQKNEWYRENPSSCLPVVLSDTDDHVWLALHTHCQTNHSMSPTGSLHHGDQHTIKLLLDDMGPKRLC